jgi:pilus assembly protein CpaE
MSEDESTETSVLLPSAGIAVFSRDQETTDTVKSLEKDWRFARVRVEAIEGDVETAIDVYAGASSPDLVVVQTDDINEGFAERLEKLAGNCKEDTAAIVIGPVNDVYLYRKLIGMGVSDYLVRPINPKDFAEVIAKTLIERMGAIGSHLVAFLGAKGGVGTSTAAHMAAWGAAHILNEKTFLLDAAGGWSTTGVSLGFDPTTTLPEVLRVAQSGDEDNLKRMLVHPHEKLSVLATGGDVMLDHEPAPKEFEALIDLMMTRYPVVLVDLSGAPAPLVRTVCARAHKVVLVSTPNVSSLRLVRTLLQELSELRGGSRDNIDLVINKSAMSPAGEVDKKDIEAALEKQPDLVIPFDAKLFVGGEGQGKKFFESKSAAEAMQSITDIIKPLVAGDKSEDDNQAAAKKGLKGGILGMFSRKT